jgi:hypothetical protein
MAEVAAPVQLRAGLDRVTSNLRRWSSADWLLFWVVIPAILLIIYALPQEIRDTYFVLNTAHLQMVQTIFLSSYTHSQLFPHLLWNLAFYFVVLAMIFAFEDNRRRFRIMAGWAFLAVPIVSSVLTILFWGFLGRTTTGQGFSAVVGALLAYAMFIFVVWALQDKLPVFDHPEEFAGDRIRFLVLQVLLAIMLVLIMVMGLMTGIFNDAGGSVTNGIAHFGGYVSSLVILFLFDERTARRRYFDAILGSSIAVGIATYLYYLVLIVRLVRGS